MNILLGMLGEVARILDAEDRTAMAGTIREAQEVIGQMQTGYAALQRQLDEAQAAQDGRKLETLPPMPTTADGRPDASVARETCTKMAQVASQLPIKRPRAVEIPPEALFGDAPIYARINRKEAEAVAKAFYYDELRVNPMLLDADDPRHWKALSEKDRERRIRQYTGEPA